MAIKKSSSSGIPFGNNAGRPAVPGTGQLYSNGETQRLELYTSSGSWENIVQEVPGVSSITGNYSEATNSGVITVYGTNFTSGAIAVAIGSNAVQTQASSTVFNSLVQLTATFNNLSAAYEPYDVKVINPSNLFGILPDALYINQTPIWTTASGNIGTIYDASSQGYSVQVAATDPESTPLTYSISSGSLPNGLSLSSTGMISGNAVSVVSDTTYTFTISATDGLNSSSRSFNLIRKAPVVQVFSYTGADQVFTFPASGFKTISCKIWGAGGGNGPVYLNGGGGGFTSGTLTVPSGTSSYRVVVGQSYGYEPKTTLGYGGAGYRTGTAGNGANGGGLSGIFTDNGSAITFNSTGQARAIAIAGGGGGTGYDNQAYGGAGGGTTGGTGQGAGSFTPCTGGTQSAGGSGNNATGTQLAGASSPNNNNGGGGGGYWGGGTSNGGSSDPGGGGGSGYVGGTGSHIFTGTTTIGENGINGPKNPAGTSDSNWDSVSGKSNQHGRVVIIY